MSEWQPIETAPISGWDKDNGPLVLGCDDKGLRQVTYALDVGDVQPCQGWDDPYDCNWQPTMWQPLPPAPSPKETRENG